jgi:hypothetical protein
VLLRLERVTVRRWKSAVIVLSVAWSNGPASVTVARATSSDAGNPVTVSVK